MKNFFLPTQILYSSFQNTNPFPGYICQPFIIKYKFVIIANAPFRFSCYSEISSHATRFFQYICLYKTRQVSQCNISCYKSIYYYSRKVTNHQPCWWFAIGPTGPMLLFRLKAVRQTAILFRFRLKAVR